jgi:hypothetical protein
MQPSKPAAIGGTARKADLSGPPLRRRCAAAVEFGDAWYPGSNSQMRRLDTPARLREAVGELFWAAQAAGRSPASMGVCLLVQDPFEWAAQKTNDGSARRLFTGACDDMLADAAALEALGLGHVAGRLGGASFEESLELIDRSGREIIAPRR